MGQMRTNRNKLKQKREEDAIPIAAASDQKEPRHVGVRRQGTAKEIRQRQKERAAVF